jgi:hypothetical protein
MKHAKICPLLVTGYRQSVRISFREAEDNCAALCLGDESAIRGQGRLAASAFELRHDMGAGLASPARLQ